jgi:hypothetical protein
MLVRRLFLFYARDRATLGSEGLRRKSLRERRRFVRREGSVNTQISYPKPERRRAGPGRHLNQRCGHPVDSCEYPVSNQLVTLQGSARPSSRQRPARQNTPRQFPARNTPVRAALIAANAAGAANLSAPWPFSLVPAAPGDSSKVSTDFVNARPLTLWARSALGPRQGRTARPFGAMPVSSAGSASGGRQPRGPFGAQDAGVPVSFINQRKIGGNHDHFIP